MKLTLTAIQLLYALPTLAKQKSLIFAHFPPILYRTGILCQSSCYGACINRNCVAYKSAD